MLKQANEGSVSVPTQVKSYDLTDLMIVSILTSYIALLCNKPHKNHNITTIILYSTVPGGNS